MGNDDTQVMNTVKVNIIQGTVHGITEPDYQRLSGFITPIIECTSWRNDSVVINSCDKPPYLGTWDIMEGVFNSIAGCVTTGKYGKVGFIGLVGKREIIGIVYFGHKKWEFKEFSRPEMPAWYKNEEWYKREKWEEELEWDALFGKP